MTSSPAGPSGAMPSPSLRSRSAAPWRARLLQEALHDNRQSPVPDQAAFRIDFPEWLGTLTDRDRRLIQDLAVGHRAQDLARKYGVSPSRVSRQRRAFRDAWLQFQGDLPAEPSPAEAVEAGAACR
jgi:hypothetical protein